MQCAQILHLNPFYASQAAEVLNSMVHWLGVTSAVVQEIRWVAQFPNG